MAARWHGRGKGRGVQSGRGLGGEWWPRGTGKRREGRSGAGGRRVGAAETAHKNSNIFDLFKGIPERSDLIRLKDGFSELKNFQIKYGCDGIKIRNNFPHCNFSKFGLEFELKI
jgi:hypothetical protein